MFDFESPYDFIFLDYENLMNGIDTYPSWYPSTKSL